MTLRTILLHPEVRPTFLRYEKDRNPKNKRDLENALAKLLNVRERRSVMNAINSGQGGTYGKRNRTN